LANKDHSLDDKIIKAAYSEFLAYGFCKASLHKISEKAGVTAGAIYTRYKNKDALFVALLQDFFEAMKVMFAPVAKEYEKAITLSRHATFHVLAKVRIIRRYILFVVTHDYEFLNRACNCYIQIERVSESAERKKP
jgi:AcrR family transcriptional regulator